MQSKSNSIEKKNKKVADICIEFVLEKRKRWKPAIVGCAIQH